MGARSDWTIPLLAPFAVVTVARALGTLGAVAGLIVAVVALARPWAAAEPAMAVLTLDPLLPSALATAALAGG